MDFKSIAEKLKRIDEGVEDQVAECGMMPPMGGMMPPPQQDSVSMNVSMNAQGKGGIRDLMDVLKNIENTVDGGNIDSVIGSDPHRAEIDADPEVNISMPDHPEGNDDDEELVVIDKQEDEAYDNQPSVDYQDNDYMQQTLAGGADEPQKMTKGGYNNVDNAITMASILPVAAMVGRMKEGLQENIQTKLQAHYDRLKEAGIESQPPLRMNPARPQTSTPRPAGIDPVNNPPVKYNTQNVAPQANRPGLDPKGDPKLWDIQFELQKRGYKIKADGLNGPGTQKAAADAGLIDAIRQDVANPTAASTFGNIGHAIGSGLGWVETAWRNLKTGFSQGRAGMEESADLDDIKKLSGLN